MRTSWRGVSCHTSMACLKLLDDGKIRKYALVETLIGLSFIGIGCVILFVGVRLFRRSFQLIRKGIRTVGRIVGIRHYDHETASDLEVVFIVRRLGGESVPSALGRLGPSN